MILLLFTVIELSPMAVVLNTSTNKTHKNIHKPYNTKKNSTNNTKRNNRNKISV
jgi:hypothetical protein